MSLCNKKLYKSGQNLSAHEFQISESVLLDKEKDCVWAQLEQNWHDCPPPENY